METPSLRNTDHHPQWAKPALWRVRVGSRFIGKPENQLRPWDLVERRGSRMSPSLMRATRRPGTPSPMPLPPTRSRITDQTFVVVCGRRRVTWVAGCRLQPDRMETCDPEEPYEGKLHVRFCGGSGGASPRIYPDSGPPTLACARTGAAAANRYNPLNVFGAVAGGH